jgi:hypothetical protein
MNESEKILHVERVKSEIKNNVFARTGFIFLTNENIYIPGCYIPFYQSKKLYMPTFAAKEQYHWNLDIFPLQYITKIDVNLGLGSPNVSLRFKKIPYLFMEDTGTWLSNLARESVGLGRRLHENILNLRLNLNPHRYHNEEKSSVKERTIELGVYIKKAALI